MRLHPFKEYLLVYDEEAETILLVFDILCRLFIYRWLVKLEKMKTDSALNGAARFVGSFMLTLLYTVLQEVVDDKITEYQRAEQFDEKARARNRQIRAINSLMVAPKKGAKI